MRRVRIMAAECADLILTQNQDPTDVVPRYFQEILDGLGESKKLHPAKEQVDFVFRESGDRWVQFCAKLTKRVSLLELNQSAFDQWSDGKPHLPLVISFRRTQW